MKWLAFEHFDKTTDLDRCNIDGG